jgi:hypothetical protein
VSKLVLSIMGSHHKSVLTMDFLLSIYIRTQGNPGDVESLILAFKEDINQGLRPSIEVIRTPGQQSIIQKFDQLEPHL